MTIPEVLDEYPQLEMADILACIVYGAEMSQERFVELPIEFPTSEYWGKSFAESDPQAVALAIRKECLAVRF